MKWKCIVGETVFICELAVFDGKAVFCCDGFVVHGVEVAIMLR